MLIGKTDGFEIVSKTPKELHEAIEKLGPLPRCIEKCGPTPRHFRKLGLPLADWVKANTIQDREQAVENAKAIYAHARGIALELRKSKSDLPTLPPSETDPFLGLQTITEWCIDAERRVNAQQASKGKRMGF
jgi:hypothetical protein